MKAAGGIGLGGILVVIALLYFTGAGGWLLTGLQRLSQNCSSMIPSVATSVGYPMCSGLSKGVNVIDAFSTKVGDILRKGEDTFHSIFSSTPRVRSISELTNALRGAGASLASSKESLNQMIRNGPNQFTGGNIAQQFQQAVDGFTIGQFYMHKGGNISQALPWLQQSARQPSGFGVMSQLSLGNFYSQGGGGIPANPAQARAYYQMASQSLTQLGSNGSPQAQQMLNSLPASPQEIQRQIAVAVKQLNQR